MRIGERTQFRDPHTVGKLRPQGAPALDAQARLADAACTAEGEKAVRGGKCTDRRDFGFTTDQLRHPHRQIRARARRRANVRAGTHDVQRREQLITVSGNGSQQLAIGPQRLAHRRDLHQQIVLLHHAPRPDAGDQLVLAEDRPVGLHQRQQHVEGAAAQLDGDTVGEQLAAMRMQLEAGELERA